MDIAIVTGANTRIGLAISRKLIAIGCRVYGLGSHFRDFPLENVDFVPVVCDLTNTAHLCKVVQEILDKEKNIYVLVNHARHMNLSPHAEQDLNDLESLVHTNLLAPLILTRLALPSLIRLSGYVLNIGFPDLPGSHRLGSAFLSTEVALQHFSDRLYEEVRQDKVKVCSLILDTANVESMFQEGFTERDNHDLIVCSEATAQAVEYVISQKRESVISRLVVRPQKREPNARDRKEARTLAAPKPYTAKQPGGKVVVGRLQKETESKPDEKAPTTYMEMVREIAEEEARQSQSKSGATDSDSVPKRRRRRRRGRRSNPSEPAATQDGKLEKGPNQPLKEPVDGSDEPQKSSTGADRSHASEPGKDQLTAKPRQRFRGPAKKSAKKKIPAQKRVAKKVVAKKQPISTEAAPAKKTPAKKSTIQKAAAKKITRKRAAKKATKRPANRRHAPKTKESQPGQ